MRVLVVDTYYPSFLSTHYREHPGLEKRSYDEQLRALMGRFFGTSDAYSRNLRGLGHDAWEVVPNCAPLQAAWLRENPGGERMLRFLARRGPGRAAAAARLLLQRRIVRAQAEAYEADVVYCQDLWFFGRADLRRMRSEGRLVVGQVASEPPGPESLREFDLITTSFPHYVERFRSLGVDSEYLRIGFDDRVLDRIGDGRPERGMVFAGGLNPGVHGQGVRLLEALARSTEIDFWGYGADELPDGSPILDRYHGEAWGLEMYRVLRGSRIVVNRHIAAAEGFANNMRLYETTGVGSLLVTESAPNLGDLFEPGTEVVTYEDADDLVEKARHYLANEDERATIARAGHERTLREHTYGQVIGDLATMLEGRLQ
jgi:hypothetical protein